MQCIAGQGCPGRTLNGLDMMLCTESQSQEEKIQCTAGQGCPGLVGGPTSISKAANTAGNICECYLLAGTAIRQLLLVVDAIYLATRPSDMLHHCLWLCDSGAVHIILNIYIWCVHPVRPEMHVSLKSYLAKDDQAVLQMIWG